jgi:ribose 5-phosphate isomerase RpiB
MTDDTTAKPRVRTEHHRRRTFESVLARVVATAGIVGIGTALGAILIAADVAGWISGLVVSIVTVTLAAMLWQSQRLTDGRQS